MIDFSSDTLNRSGRCSHRVIMSPVRVTQCFLRVTLSLSQVILTEGKDLYRVTRCVSARFFAGLRMIWRKRIHPSSWLFASLFILSFMATSPARAQDFVTDVSNNGTVAAAFLEIGVGARAEAMGGAYTAQAGNADMIYWNAAGLAFMDGVGTAFTHTEWLAGTTFDFFSIAAPLPFFNAVVGASFTTLAVPDQPVRTIAAPEGTGEFYDARDFAVNFAISARLIPTFSFGLSGKLINQRIWTEQGSQFALDAGVFYQTPLPGLSIGASISNFGADLSLAGKNLNDIIDPDPANRGIENIPVTYKTDTAPLPQIFRFGLSYSTPLPGRGALVTSVDLMHPTGSTESMNMGIEYGFNDLFFLRAGYLNRFERNSVNGLTLGGGLKYTMKDRSDFIFDYAYSDWGILENVHRISVGVYL